MRTKTYPPIEMIKILLRSGHEGPVSSALQETSKIQYISKANALTKIVAT